MDSAAWAIYMRKLLEAAKDSAERCHNFDEFDWCQGPQSHFISIHFVRTKDCAHVSYIHIFKATE